PHRVHTRRSHHQHHRPQTGRVHRPGARRAAAQGGIRLPRPLSDRRRVSGVPSGLGTGLPTGAGDIAREFDSAAESWGLAAPALLREIEQRAFVSRATASYQFGDAVLEMDGEHASLVAPFPDLYGDCAVTGSRPPGLAAVRCIMRRSFEPPVVALRFEAGAPVDLA